MGIFSTTKKGISKKPVEEWPREGVLRWLTYLGKEKYAEQFKAVTGKRLLQLSAVDLKQLVDTKLDADLLLDSIQELRKRDGLAPQELQESEGAPSLAPSGTGSGSSLTAHMKSLPPVNTKLNGVGRVGAGSSVSSGSRTPVSTATPTVPVTRELNPFDTFLDQDVLNATQASGKGIAENAEVLSSLVGGHDVVNDLFAYMSFLGIQGMGLVEATERSPIVGHIIGALWELHDQVTQAKGNRGNCLQLDSYGQDIMRVFDAEGKRLAFISKDALTRIMQFIEEGIAIVENCSKPGWLLRMANAERSIEEFQTVHNGILEKLRAEKVDTLPNGRQLTYGEYRDASRPLRRCLKQLGSGSLDGGLAAVAHQEPALNEVCQLIGIEKQAVLKDLHFMAGQPELDLLSTQDQSSASGEYSPMSPVGGRSKEYQTIFAQYDKNQSGALEFEELRSVLADLGLLDGIKPTEIENFTLQQFTLADVDQDNRVDYDEFVNFYQSISTSKARRELRSALGPQAEKDLKKIFFSFASFGVRQNVDEMDGAKFSKLCRDCKLLSRAFTTIDVDLIFAKTKVKGQRRINFDGFLSALARVAEKKGLALEDVVRQILAAGGPTVTGTKANYVKFHDDKSTYTGVYSRGGPTNVDPSKDLSSLLDRSEADVRGIKKSATLSRDGSLTGRATPPSRQSFAGSEPPLTARGGPSSRRESASGSTTSRAASLTGERDASSQIHLGLATGRVSSSGLPPTAPRSSNSGTPKSIDAILAAGRSSNPGTPKSMESSQTALNGTLAPPAGNGTSTPPAQMGVSPRKPNEGSFCAPEAIKRISGEGGTPDVKSSIKVPKLPMRQASQEDLQAVFAAFASFGSRGVAASASPSAPVEMDGAKFAKLCRDSQLLDNSFNSTSVDIIFSKVKAKGARRIAFKDFEKALEEIAVEKKTSVELIQQKLVACGGPKRTKTTPNSHVRLHDDKSTFTGVYKAGGPSVIDKHITLQSLTDRTNSQATSRPRMSL